MPSSYYSDQSEQNAEMLDEQELQALYTWVDSIPLSRPKKNISRDFADGVLMAEIVKHYFPRMIQLHNYSSASSTTQKLYNWNTLNQKFFKKVGFQVSKQEINDVVNAKPGAIECLLRNFQARLNHMRAHKGNNSDFEHSRDISEPKRRERSQSAKRTKPLDTQSVASHRSSSRGPTKQSPGRVSSIHNGYPAASSISDPNDPRVKELQETVKILEAKVNKLNLLIRLKDSKIHALTEKLKQSNIRV